MNVMDFYFENADRKGRSLGYILWLGMVMWAFIWDVYHLLPETSLSIPTKFCVKKMLKEFSEFCNVVVCFMICYSCYEFSSLQPVLSIFCIPNFMYKEIRKWYSLTSFEVHELLPSPLSWEIRFLSKYLCGE